MERFAAGRFFPVACGEDFQFLPAQNQGGRPVLAQHGLFPGLAGLGGVGRADGQQVRDDPERGHVLHGLVRGAVLAHRDAVVGEHVDHRKLHQAGQANGGAHVVGEHQKRAAVGPQAAVQGHAGDNGAHGVFPDAEPDVPSFWSVLLKNLRTVDEGLVGRRQIGGTAHQVEDLSRDGVQDLAGGRPGGDRGGADEIGNLGIPAVGQFAVHELLVLLGQLGIFFRVAIKELLPCLFGFSPFFDAFAENVAGVVADAEILVFGAAQVLLGQTYLFGAQRRAVGVGTVLLVGAAVGDMGPELQNDQRRSLSVSAWAAFSAFENLEPRVLAVFDRQSHASPQAFEPLGRHVFGKGDIGVAFDGDMRLSSYRHDQFAQAQMAGQRGRFIAQTPLHQVPVAAHHIGKMVHNGRSP